MVWGHARQGQRSITPLSLPYHVFTPQKHGHARVQCVEDAAMCPALRLFTFLLTNTEKDYRLRASLALVHLAVLGPGPVGRVQVGCEVVVVVQFQVPLNIVGCGVVVRVAGNTLLRAMLLVYADVVESHVGGEFQIVPLDLLETTRDAQVHDNKHRLFGEDAAADLGILIT